MKKFLTIISFFIICHNANAQFIGTAPSRDGSISTNEYGSHTIGNNAWSDGSRTWYMTWDATNLYIAVSSNGNATTDELVLYIDTDPQTIVNGGANSNGCSGGIGGFDGNNYGVLPFRANFNAHIRNDYHQHRTSNNDNTWATNTDNSSSITKTSSGNLQEISIAWSLMGGKPSSFNFFFYLNGGNPYGGVSNYGSSTDNDQTNNLNLTGRQYFSVANTSNGSSIYPFSRLCYVNPRTTANTLTSYGTSYYDVTLNAASTTTSLGADLAVANLFYIASTNTLAASSAARTITFSGTSSTLGLQCDGAITQTTNAVKLACTSGTTTLSGTATNSSYILGDIAVSNGATIQAPSSGTIDIGLQAATLGVSTTGIMNFVNGSGVVNATVVDPGSTNTVNINNSSTGTITFNNLTINTNGVVRPIAGGSLTHLINVKGNIVRTGSLTTGPSSFLSITMNGTAAQSLPSATYQNLTISNTTADVTATGTIVIASGKALTIDANARLDIGNNTFTITGATCNINGFFRYGKSTAPNGHSTSTLIFNNGGTYEHNTNGGVVPTATWNTGSTCAIIGTTGTVPTGLGQSFYNFTWNCTGQSGSRNLNGTLTNVTGTFSVISTGSPTPASLRLNNSLDLSQVDYIGNIANISLSGGLLGLIGGTANSGTVAGSTTLNVSGNISLSGSAVLDMNATGAGLSSTINLSGNLTTAGTSIIQRNSALTNGASINFNKSSGTQTFTQTAGTITDAINWNVGTTNSPTFQLGSNVNIGTGVGTFVVANNSTIDCSTYILSGSSSFTLNAGSTLLTTNTNSAGGVTGTGSNGSIQLSGTRTYNGDVNYNATGAQTIGAANYNNLIVSGNKGNAVVTLASSGTIGISGSFTISATNVSYTVTSSTIDFNKSTGGQTIPAFNYNNLTISNSSGTNTLASSGTIGIAGTFNPSSQSYTITSSTIDFNKSTGGQTIPAFNYNNLTISNSSGTNTLASSGTIGIAGTFNPSSQSYTITSSTIDFNKSTGGQTIPAFNYNNLTISNSSGTNTLASSGTIGIAGTFSPSSQTYTVTGSTIDFNKSTGGQTVPAFSYNNLTLSAASGTVTTAASGTINIGTELKLSGKVALTSGGSTLTYTAGGTLTMNGTSSIALIGSNPPEWPSSNGPTNLQLLSNTLSWAAASSISRSVTGIITLNGGNFTINSSNTLTLASGSTINRTSGLITVSSGTFSFGSSSSDVVNVIITGNNLTSANELPSGPTAGIALTVNGSSYTIGTSNKNNIKSLALNGSIDNPSFSLTVKSDITGTGTHTGGLITMSSNTVTSNISGVTFNNLTLNDADGFSLSGSPTINGLLTLTTGNLDINGNTISLAGTVSRTSGSLSANGSGSTVVISGPSSIPSSLFTSNSVRNLTVSRSGGITMSSDITIGGLLTLTSGKLAINGNTLTLNGTVSGLSGSNSLVGSNSSKLTITSTSSVGSVFFDQTTDGNILNPTSGTNALQNLVVSGSGGTLTLANKVNLFERLKVGAGATLVTGDSLVLRSIAGTSGNNTAYVDSVGVGGTISGQVRVERYVHAQSRGWRAITAPVTYAGLTITNNSNSVANNWQNSWGLGTNYGTRVTGPSATNGLDDVSVSASLKTYSGSTGAWNNVTNTNTETMASTASSAANKSFFMYVRGDRTVTPNGYNPLSFQATTLPTRGKLQTGTQTFTLSGPANNYWLIGNPYACPVDMSTVSLSNIATSIYVWDPNLTGSDIYSQGAYATFSTAAWVASGGSSTKYFQSGQAFFVQPTTSSASITFNESNKSTGNQNNQTAGTGNGLSDIFQIKLSFVDANNIVRETDGVMAMYGSGYSAGNDSYDAIKWTTAGRENLSLSRNNKSLVIEARPYITGLDTLFLSMTSMSVGANYQFKVNPVNFDASVSSCKLVDKFLNTETPISLTNTTLVGFNVTSVSGSNAAGRFYVVFNAAGSLPTSNSLTVKAYKQNNNNIKIDWEAIAENNVKTYTVEKSTDAASFTKLSEATAKNGNTTNTYSIVDNNPVIGVNYYRIQSIQTNNNKAYSAIVRVEMSDKGVKSITVYPNPVKSNSNTIGLQMNNLTAGSYTAVLYNTAGQQVWMNTMNHNGSNGSTSLQLNKTLASGTYQLQLTDTKGNSYKQTVLVVE